MMTIGEPPKGQVTMLIPQNKGSLAKD